MTQPAAQDHGNHGLYGIDPFVQLGDPLTDALVDVGVAGFRYKLISIITA